MKMPTVIRRLGTERRVPGRGWLMCPMDELPGVLVSGGSETDIETTPCRLWGRP